VTNETRTFTELTRGEHVLGSAKLEGDPWDDDFVLYWSTELDACEFIAKCDHLRYAPGELLRIDIIADNKRLSMSDEHVLEKLKDKRIVRFNAADWSITWLSGDHGAPAEIQAVMARVPQIMSKMVSGSVSGFSSDDIANVLKGLDPAA
jgi:hypothetical protein